MADIGTESWLLRNYTPLSSNWLGLYSLKVRMGVRGPLAVRYLKCEYSTMASALALQAWDGGSIPLIRSRKHPATSFKHSDIQSENVKMASCKCRYSTTVSVPACHAGDASSILVIYSILD